MVDLSWLYKYESSLKTKAGNPKQGGIVDNTIEAAGIPAIQR